MVIQGGHRPVLLAEAVEALAVQAAGRYVDGTYGRGGHAEAILSGLGGDGRLWVVDRDPEAIASARARYGDDPRVRIRRGNFAELGPILAEDGAPPVDGILLDLGVSSPQLDDAERGFSFTRDGPLDMRMDPETGPSAHDYLATVGERDLVRALRVHGEERFARRIARAIVRAREAGELPATTAALAELVAGAVPRREHHKNPATRTFQALRITVNGERDALAACLDQVCDLLAPGGRLAVISFHSLEDRMVKRFIRGAGEQRDLPPGIPVVPEALRGRLRPVGRAIQADEAARAENPRARSAVLRVAERLP